MKIRRRVEKFQLFVTEKTIQSGDVVRWTLELECGHQAFMEGEAVTRAGNLVNFPVAERVAIVAPPVKARCLACEAGK